MDTDIRTLERNAARTRRRADRIRYRRAVERQGEGGTRKGLREGDLVKIRSCVVVAWKAIEHYACVRKRAKGTTDDTPPRLSKAQENGATVVDHWGWFTDVTGCPKCSVTLIEAGGATPWTKPPKERWEQ